MHKQKMKNKNIIIHPFEFIGAYRLYEEERFLLADEMGMFKTAQAIFANNKFREKKSNLRTLIICPTSVREHWVRELQKWAYPQGEINVIYAGKINKGIQDAKKANWTIVSYPLASRIENGLLDKLQNNGFHHVIADEVHNAKNPDALRTRALKTLTDNADYVSLLSGTPIPNTMSDLYVLMSILNPQEYPFNPEKASSDSENFRRAKQSFIQLYLTRPQAVKELLHKKMLRRGAKDYLSEYIPEAENHLIEVPLTKNHLSIYQEVVEKDMNVGKKIMDLAKASIDPCLIDSSLREKNGKEESNKYIALDDIIRREIGKKNGKVLVFSNLKEGIIDYLTEKYYSFGAINITGDVLTKGGVRENLRQKFQHDPNTRVLFATTTMNEGVDLTAATAVVDLTIPLTPAERHQRWKRSHRPGEIKKDKVDIYTLCSSISGPQDSLDIALLNMVDGKEKIVNYLLSGMQISLEELKEYDKTEKVPKIVRAITSPNKAVFKHYLKWRGIGSESASRRIKKYPDISHYIAELYPNFSMAKNSADIYIPIIKEIEKNKKLEVKVDIGCGPGMLGYFLDEPTIGIDIDPNMIKEGKKIYPKNRLSIATMNSLPLRDNLADLILCSLAFQMTEPKQERARTLYEMSRILKQKGYSIITIPNNYMNTNNKKRFNEIVNKYGFEIKDYQKEVGKSKIDVYVLQKTQQADTNRNYSLKWNGDIKRKSK